MVKAVTLPESPDWIEKHGDSQHSVELYNLAFTQAVLNNHAELINKIGEIQKGSLMETANQLDAITARIDKLEDIETEEVKDETE